LDGVISLVSLDNGYLASGSIDSQIKIWDTEKGHLVFTFNSTNGGHSDKVNSLVYIDNAVLCSASTDGNIKLWDISN
jgi:WD40 repeat protein